jgi:hypothetical protein
MRSAPVGITGPAGLSLAAGDPADLGNAKALRLAKRRQRLLGNERDRMPACGGRKSPESLRFTRLELSGARRRPPGASKPPDGLFLRLGDQQGDVEAATLALRR